ncbi:two-component regulator propeller domain-containing protein [Undibacterium sp.]|uniref:sensor histidine kinase n=1 Tax=Undibacterium sp. TaxID=1914977 RepID=UPI00374DF08A
MTGTRIHTFAANLTRNTGGHALSFLLPFLLPFSLLLSVVLSAFACLPAHAAKPVPEAPPINLQHTSWTVRDGAPAVVLTMAQTTDGWLWLGSSSGLFRFDGVRFERYAPHEAPLPAAAISILSAQPSGALWIGYRFGGASLLNAGKLRNYDQHDGLPENASVWGIEQDGVGRVWAATTAGMYYLEGEHWLAAAPSWALPPGSYKTLLRDHQGILWAQGNLGVYSLAPGANYFTKAATDSGAGVVFDAPDGSIWSWDARNDKLNRLTRPSNVNSANSANPANPKNQASAVTPARHWNVQGDVDSLLSDRAGNLWVGRRNSLEYYTTQGVQRTGPRQGLSGNTVSAVLEDREGNIWAATANGIDRFRRKRLSEVPMPGNLSATAMAADTEGGAWLGRFHATRSDPIVFTELWPSAKIPWHDYIISEYRGPDGVLWAGSYGGLWRKEGTRARRIAMPPELEGEQINSLVADNAGGLWATVQGKSVYRLDPSGSWEKQGGKEGLPEEAPRTLAGNGKDLWFAYPRNRLMQREDGHWRKWGPEDGLGLGLIATLHLHGKHVWAGGENGLALRQGEKFISVIGVGEQGFQGLSGIVELDNGDLWLNSGTGLYRIPADELARLEDNAAYRVHYERVDSSDGLEGNAPFPLPAPTLVETSDHHLWVSTTAGVFRFDPALRLATVSPPPVLIRSISAQGQERALMASMHLPPGTDTLQINYTAVALTMPERVHFRYRLQGLEQSWQDAGQRRAAYYNNLGPGDYRFQVQASNYDGIWDEKATTLDFSIAPTLVQTWWFKSLCALALLVACWLGYRWRIRHLAHEVELRLEERISERERIARELHDTFLQSVYGLVLQVNAAVLRLPTPEPARVMIEKALLQASDVLREGRDKVRALRTGTSPIDLGEALQLVGANLRPPDGAPLQLRITGKERSLHPIVHEEALAIANEAIANAYRHAKAAQIAAELHYGSDELRLTVRDNGIGIPPDVMAAGELQDHWGLPGMRERAARIKARLVLHSHAGAGTVWTLVLPGALAYQEKPWRLWQTSR